ncbi:hypothetical protein M409DRAFT_20247 [Zasmidium cellare ATCC 36951]|uniref:GPI anchored protein n=1 Tax=Zasmidium cellare ATCC 36951 TaxID=1080233 RepID=A0A6A6CRP8_ZASCE|nr:uncharacterized protein M409DRAFT_20247 [Zasmidium cellare ATCC 36951]KAF2169834.1 hypothetical protein M409DRAFT_20247 [Zasmidium cellare ATCC 36951]
MRSFDISATALFAAAAVVNAQTPDSYGSLTSATTTYTITRTVSRVVETVTATSNGSTSTFESTSSLTTSISIPLTTTATAYSHPPSSIASVTIPSYGNGTTVVGGTGTGALPSASASGSFVPPPASEGGAGKLGVEALGLAAIAGIVGLLAF